MENKNYTNGQWQGPLPGEQTGNAQTQNTQPDPYISLWNSYCMRNNAFDSDPFAGKSRGIAALLAIFLGSLGVHYFYLEKIWGGFICIILCIITCCMFWPLITFIQGIVFLCMNNENFYRKFTASRSIFPVF